MSVIKNKKNLVILTAIILIGALTAFYLLRGDETQQKTEETAKTTSTEPSAQPDFTSPGNEDKKEPGNSLSENTSGAEVTDNAGSGVTGQSNPLISQTGQITLYTPTSGQLVSGNQKITGKSTLSSVSYRIIDNVSGVISTGELSVVNGNFSGTININTQATEGRFDIFSTKQDGTEFSNIEVPVRFK